jgi:hypothetical protein
MANCQDNSTSVQPTFSTACVLPFMQLSQLPSHLLPVHYPFTRPRRRAANPPNLKQQRFHKAFRTTSTGETLLLPRHNRGMGGVTCMRVCLQVDTPTTACASVRAGHGCCNKCTLLPRQGLPHICWHLAPSSGPHQQLVGSSRLPTAVKVTAVLYCHVCCWCRGEDLFGMQQHLHNWLQTPSAYDVLFVR